MKFFIPIKEESQRVPRKNFRNFNGLPLYQHFIYKILKKSSYEIFIDTDSKEILKWSEDIKRVNVYKRKEELQGHEVSVNKLIKNFIENFNVESPVAQLHVTSPLLKISTVKEAYKYLEQGYDSVVGCDVMYERFWRKGGNGKLKTVNHDPNTLSQTQDLEPLYMENSSFYIFQPSIFLNKSNRIGENPYFFEVSYPQNLDIDTEDDWKFLKKL